MKCIWKFHCRKIVHTALKTIDSLHYTQFGKVRNSRDTGGKNGFQNHMRSLEMSGTPEAGKNPCRQYIPDCHRGRTSHLAQQRSGSKKSADWWHGFSSFITDNVFQTEKNVVCQPRTECSDSESWHNVKREMHSQIDPRQSDPHYIYEQNCFQHDLVRSHPECGGYQHGESRMATWKTVWWIRYFPWMNDISTEGLGICNPNFRTVTRMPVMI